MNRQTLEIEVMRYFGSIQSQKEGRKLTDDEAGMKYVEYGYAEKYAEIYYDGIKSQELRTKLFGYDS